MTAHPATRPRVVVIAWAAVLSPAVPMRQPPPSPPPPPHTPPGVASSCSSSAATEPAAADEPDLCLLERAPIEVKGKGSMTTWWLAPAAVTDLGQGQGLAASGGSVCSTMTGCEDSALSCTAGGLSGSGDASLHTTTMMIGTAPLSRLATESRSGGAAGDRSGRPAARASGSYPRAPASPSGWQDHLQT